MREFDFSDERKAMVDRQIRARGVRDRALLEAMATVPRERFISEQLREFAYKDTPLPIAASQTISQPYIVALMIEALALRGGDRVLEIGTGSGYAAAILSKIADEVFTIERIKELADRAATLLKEMEPHNVHVRHGDGTLGWPDEAPFDAIVVSAGGPAVPESLRSQLAIGGRMVIPVGSQHASQELLRIERVSETKFKSAGIAGVRFVPLIGDQGWTEVPPPKAASKSRRRIAKHE